jgi:hypothetical protein
VKVVKNIVALMDIVGQAMIALVCVTIIAVFFVIGLVVIPSNPNQLHCLNLMINVLIGVIPMTLDVLPTRIVRALARRVSVVKTQRIFIVVIETEIAIRVGVLLREREVVRIMGMAVLL